jgi:hypothetical protein
MIVCEYLFMDFHSRGNDEYLCAWAIDVDQMGHQGWEVLECTRMPRRFGVWTVVLFRPSGNGPRNKLRHDGSEDRED